MDIFLDALIFLTIFTLLLLILLISNGRRRFRRSFFNSLERVGKRLIGLYEEGQSSGFFGLSITKIKKCFYKIGKYDKWIIAL